VNPKKRSSGRLQLPTGAFLRDSRLVVLPPADILRLQAPAAANHDLLRYSNFGVDEDPALAVAMQKVMANCKKGCRAAGAEFETSFPLKWMLLYNEAFGLFRRRDTRGAQAVYERALGKSPGADLNRSAILASIAYCMIHAGDNAGAAAMATRAVETDPTNYSGWYRRATARLNCGGDFAVMSGAGAWQLQRFLVCYDRLGVLDREDAKELAARPSDPQEGADAAGDVRLEHRLLGSGDVHGCSAAGSSPGHEPEDPRRAASGSATWLAAAGNEEDVGCRLRSAAPALRTTCGAVTLSTRAAIEVHKPDCAKANPPPKRKGSSKSKKMSGGRGRGSEA